MSRAGELKYRPFHGRESGCIQVLDYFDQSRRVETIQAAVAAQQRALQELDPFQLSLRHPFQPQLRGCDLQGSMADIHAHDALKCTVGEQAPKEFALAAPEVQYGLGFQFL